MKSMTYDKVKAQKREREHDDHICNAVTLFFSHVFTPSLGVVVFFKTQHQVKARKRDKRTASHTSSSLFYLTQHEVKARKRPEVKAPRRKQKAAKRPGAQSTTGTKNGQLAAATAGVAASPKTCRNRPEMSPPRASRAWGGAAAFSG